MFNSQHNTVKMITLPNMVYITQSLYKFSAIAMKTLLVAFLGRNLKTDSKIHMDCSSFMKILQLISHSMVKV